MRPSTGSNLSYDMRPAKQTERLIIVDVLKSAGDAGLPISSYRYVGMGANRFYDFLLIHRHLGVKKMVSLEHDDKFFERANFNKPFGFIDVLNKTASDFIAEDGGSSRSVYWLDYDGGIGTEIIADINDYANAMEVGDFLMMTVSGNPPRVVDQVSDTERLIWIEDEFGSLAAGVGIDDAQRSAFRVAVHKILRTAFKRAFAAKNGGTFHPLLQVGYKDSFPMVTFGGAFLSDEQANALRDKMSHGLRFLSWDDLSRYRIRSLHLTDKERALFDMAVTSGPRRRRERNRLKALGFKDADLKSYGELLRYLPRYVEAIF